MKTKCKLCKEGNDMLTTDYCLKCFIKLSRYTHKIAIESLEEVGLIKKQEVQNR